MVKFRKFQQGGEMEAPQNADQAQEQGQGGGDPLMQLAQIAVQALENQDCNMAMQVCQGFVQMIQSAAPEQPSEPVYRRGGTLVRRIRK